MERKYRVRLSYPAMIGVSLAATTGFAGGVWFNASATIDKALAGALIGGLLASGGTVLANYLSFIKETEQWERQQETDEKQRKVESENKEKQRVREIYINSLHHLGTIQSSYTSPENFKKIEYESEDGSKQASRHTQPSDQLLKVIGEAHKWLSELSLDLPPMDEKERSTFLETFNAFSQKPNDFHTSKLRTLVLKIASQDTRFR